MVRGRAALAVVAVVFTFGGAAHASVDYLGTADLKGTGIGSENTVLTIQSPRNTTSEAGAVGLNAHGTQVTSGDVLKGSSQTRVRSFGSLGIGTASDLRIVFNAQEPGQEAANGVTFSDLVVNVFAPSGALLFTAGTPAPHTFDATRTGVGRAGEVFALDSQDAARLQSLAGRELASDFIGLAATINNATGGPETLFAANSAIVSVVSEPRTYALLSGGLLAVGVWSRRRPRSG